MATKIKMQTAPATSKIDSVESQAEVTTGVSHILFVLIPLLVSLCWVYWADLISMQAQWESNPQYSHGYLVPCFSLLLLYSRRDRFEPNLWQPAFSGLCLLMLGLAMKIFSAYYFIEALGHLSLVVSLAGVVAVVWGISGLKWTLPGIGFLLFMLPLPHQLEGALSLPLRTIGTKVSTYFLQTIGLPAYSEGHVIVVDSQYIGVAEACSGIRMLMVFFALSTAVALFLSESWIYRTAIVLSAIPIAIIANMLRIASTGAMYVYLADSEVFGMPGTEFASKFFHDWAGWFMMPIALGLLWLEIWVIERLTIRVADRPLATGMGIPQ